MSESSEEKLLSSTLCHTLLKKKKLDRKPDLINTPSLNFLFLKAALYATQKQFLSNCSKQCPLNIFAPQLFCFGSSLFFSLVFKFYLSCFSKMCKFSQHCFQKSTAHRSSCNNYKICTYARLNSYTYCRFCSQTCTACIFTSSSAYAGTATCGTYCRPSAASLLYDLPTETSRGKKKMSQLLENRFLPLPLIRYSVVFFLSFTVSNLTKIRGVPDKERKDLEALLQSVCRGSSSESY